MKVLQLPEFLKSQIDLQSSKESKRSSFRPNLSSGSAKNNEILHEQAPIVYRLQTSQLSTQQRRAYQVRDQNLRRQERAEASPPEETPISLSLHLSKPAKSFEEVVGEIQKNPEKLFQAHDDVNRKQALRLLVS